MNGLGQESSNAKLECSPSISEATQRHRRDIRRAMDRVRALLDQMEALAPSPAADDSDASARRKRLGRVMSLPLRASMSKNLSIALRELITLERQSYGMDAPRVVVVPAKVAKDGEG